MADLKGTRTLISGDPMLACKPVLCLTISMVEYKPLASRRVRPRKLLSHLLVLSTHHSLASWACRAFDPLYVSIACEHDTHEVPE